MVKDRNAAHVYPGMGWRWQEFGGRLMLVTDGGGADVVLSGHSSGKGFMLTTCAPDGLMTRLRPDSPLGVLLTAVPDLVEIALDIHSRNDRPHYLPRLNAALVKAGMLA